MLKFFEKPTKGHILPALIFVGTLVVSFYVAVAVGTDAIGGWAILVLFGFYTWFAIGVSFGEHYDSKLIGGDLEGSVGDYLVRFIWWVGLWPLAVPFAEGGMVPKARHAVILLFLMVAACGFAGMVLLAYSASGGPNFWLAIVFLLCLGYGQFLIDRDYEMDEPLPPALMPLRHLSLVVLNTLCWPFAATDYLFTAVVWLDRGGLWRYVQGEPTKTA